MTPLHTLRPIPENIPRPYGRTSHPPNIAHLGARYSSPPRSVRTNPNDHLVAFSGYSEAKPAALMGAHQQYVQKLDIQKSDGRRKRIVDLSHV
ncbi:hypothetical protein MTP99_009742 [Tenebrio molitor]|nr:hypothetical protein MTP99_009742 [Tenebrio molitor]